jgi:hypothetical protein
MGIQMKKLLLVLPMAVMAAAVAFAEPQAAPASMTPEQAITAAAANPEHGAQGEFEFVVASVGSGESARGTVVYLNSAADYRTPENLSVMIMPLTVREIEPRSARR